MHQVNRGLNQLTEVSIIPYSIKYQGPGNVFEDQTPLNLKQTDTINTLQGNLRQMPIQK
jgi:hypothetical protein